VRDLQLREIGATIGVRWANALRLMPCLLLGLVGGLVAGSQQAAWDREDPLFGNYSDERLCLWLAVGLLGPAVLVLLLDGMKKTGAEHSHGGVEAVAARRVAWAATVALLPAMLAASIFDANSGFPGSFVIGTPAFRAFVGTAVTVFAVLVALWIGKPMRPRFWDRALLTLGVSVTTLLVVAYALDLHVGPMPRFIY
jgi:hypothetical protein